MYKMFLFMYLIYLWGCVDSVTVISVESGIVKPSSSLLHSIHTNALGKGIDSFPL